MWLVAYYQYRPFTSSAYLHVVGSIPVGLVGHRYRPRLGRRCSVASGTHDCGSGRNRARDCDAHGARRYLFRDQSSHQARTEGDLSPYTIADVVNMVVCAGGIPLFADIERETCNIDASEVERLIDDSVGAVMVIHFYGLACDIKRIAAVCKGRRVPLIEDAAQAFGVIVDGQAVGTFGQIGILSFGMYKNVNSFLGGMIVTSDAATETKIRQEINKLPYQPLGGYLGKVLQAFFTDVVTFPPLFRAAFFWLFRYAFIHDIYLINRRLQIAHPNLKTKMPAEFYAA